MPPPAMIMSYELFCELVREAADVININAVNETARKNFLTLKILTCLLKIIVNNTPQRLGKRKTFHKLMLKFPRSQNFS